ncbi:hypothetical protein BBJ29_002958 [Phytophthora kernoviae]|uniref:Uncharacterized protein n=1 Tax=Phytophthora kernoviae TaxID=325452 RepID=A0A421FS08_9STRA|nr:hypothetical protein BBJ29_002958 [Phytophthora kernoviae]
MSRRAKMHDLACPSRRNNTVVERTMGIFVEFLDVYELPFDLRQTEKVVWASDGKGCADPNVISTQNFTDGGNTRMRSMRFPFSIEGLDVRMDMRSVTQKYVEQDRTVFIKRTLIKPTINLMSLEFIETSRIVLKRGLYLALMRGKTMSHASTTVWRIT